MTTPSSSLALLAVSPTPTSDAVSRCPSPSRTNAQPEDHPDSYVYFFSLSRAPSLPEQRVSRDLELSSIVPSKSQVPSIQHARTHHIALHSVMGHNKHCLSHVDEVPAESTSFDASTGLETHHLRVHVASHPSCGSKPDQRCKGRDGRPPFAAMLFALSDPILGNWSIDLMRVWGK